MSGSVGWGFWDLRKAESWVPASERESRYSELAEARRICAWRALRFGWVESWRYKNSQHRKIVSLSFHVEKPLNSKRWIKVSYLNQFRVFAFLYMLMSITSISHIRIMGMLHCELSFGVYCGQHAWTSVTNTYSQERSRRMVEGDYKPIYSGSVILWGSV